MPFALHTIYAHVHASTRCVYNTNIVEVYMHACMRAERCVRVCVCVCVCAYHAQHMSQTIGSNDSVQ